MRYLHVKIKKREKNFCLSCLEQMMRLIPNWVATPCPYKEPEHCKAVIYKVPPSHIYSVLVFAFCHFSSNSLDCDTKWVLFLEPAGLRGLSSGRGPGAKLRFWCENGRLHPHNFRNEKTESEPGAPGTQGQQRDISLVDAGMTRICVKYSTPSCLC